MALFLSDSLFILHKNSCLRIFWLTEFKISEASSRKSLSPSSTKDKVSSASSNSVYDLSKNDIWSFIEACSCCISFAFSKFDQKSGCADIFSISWSLFLLDSRSKVPPQRIQSLFIVFNPFFYFNSIHTVECLLFFLFDYFFCYF